MARITIIIPTLDRSAFVARTLRHLSTMPLRYAFDIAVFDGSLDRGERTRNRVLCEEAGAIYRPFDPSIDVFPRIAIGAGELESEYVLFFADDNFLTPETALCCVRFLDAHADFTCCMGSYITFHCAPPRMTLTTDQFRASRSYEEPTAPERLFRSLRELPRTIFYSIHRRADFADSMQRVARATASRWYDFQFADPLFHSLTVARGKVGNVHAPLMAIETKQSVPREKYLFAEETLLDGRDFHSRYAAAKRELADFGLSSEVVDALWSVFIHALTGPRRMASRLKALFPGAGFPRPSEYRTLLRDEPVSSPRLREHAFVLNFLASHSRIETVTVKEHQSLDEDCPVRSERVERRYATVRRNWRLW